MAQDIGHATGSLAAALPTLLAAAGPPAPSDIRAQVNTQAGIDDPAPGFTDKLMFWVLPREPGVTIDATGGADGPTRGVGHYAHVVVRRLARNFPGASLGADIVIDTLELLEHALLASIP